VRGTLDSILRLVAGEEEKWMGLVVVGRCLTDSVMPSRDDFMPATARARPCSLGSSFWPHF